VKKTIWVPLLIMFSLMVLSSRAFALSYTFQQLTFDNVDHLGISVSSSGEVIWNQEVGGSYQINSLSRGQLTPNDGWSYYDGDVNVNGELVCNRAKMFTGNYIYSNLRGMIAGGSEVSRARISDSGEVIWRYYYGYGWQYHFQSNLRGDIADGANNEADITSDGEVLYTKWVYPGDIKLFSTLSGELPYPAEVPRINNNGEIIWSQGVKVGNQEYRQIFSSVNGQVTNFYEGSGVGMGDIDEFGNIYFSQRQGSYYQVFRASPQSVVPEPSSLLLLGLGGFLFRRRRRST
jgi:hypothetical protein